MNSSFSVNTNDIIFVNVTSLGRQVMSVTLSGNNSVESLMGKLRSELADLDGLLTVNLRNSSQGTTAKRVMRMRKPGAGLLRAQMQGYAA